MTPTDSPTGNRTTAVVVPCYNEARRLDTDALREFAAQSNDVVFLFVDDGSTDGTFVLLQQLAEESPAQFIATSLPVNSGKAEAVRQGVIRAMESGFRYVGYWDADLATPLDAIPDFIQALDERPEVELVLGARVALLGRSIERSFVRHVLGRVFATVASKVLGVAVYDTQCGAKMIRNMDTTAELFSKPFLSRWIFDVEILARRKRMAGKRMKDILYEQPLNRWMDVGGSKVRPTDFAVAIYDMARIWYRYLR